MTPIARVPSVARPFDAARTGGALTGAVLGLLALAGLSLLVGGAGFGVPEWPIVWELRVPRTGLALAVGASLGLSGAVLQGALRNPLADPGLLGVGGAAALGAVIVFYWGVSAVFAPALVLGGMAGAGVGCAALLALAGRAPSGPAVILGGVAVSSLAAALLALALTLAPNPFALAEVSFWLLGGLEDRSLLHLALAVPPIVLGLFIMARLGPGLDALSLGEATAASLGRPVSGTLRRAAVGASLAVGAGAAVAGGIGFVGLVVPHLLRPWIGDRPGALLVPSALAGAGLLLSADLLARAAPLLLPLQAEPRLGVLTALLGTPVLIRLSRRVVA